MKRIKLIDLLPEAKAKITPYPKNRGYKIRITGLSKSELTILSDLAKKSDQGTWNKSMETKLWSILKKINGMGKYRQALSDASIWIKDGVFHIDTGN